MTKSFIPYSTQSIDIDDIRAVNKILSSRWITQGPTVKKFEDALAKYAGAKYAVTMVNGTAALHAAYLAAGISPGDEVLVPTLSFVASANCVLYCGATPILVDVYDDTLTIDVEKAEAKITKKTKAIVAVDFAGHPANWSEITILAKKYKLVTIDDASHALGSKYVGKFIGNMADLTTFSFHPAKTITTGEGGAVITNSKSYFEKLIKFRNHGITKSEGLKKKYGAWFYEINDLGFNFRLTDIQAALGLSQLKRLNKFIIKRRKIWNVYNKAFSSIKGVRLPIEKEGNYSAWHLYPIRIDKKKFGLSRRDLFDRLQREGISVQVHYIPIDMHKLYRNKFGYKKGDFPAAEKYYKEAISIPLFPELTVSDQYKVINLIKKYATNS